MTDDAKATPPEASEPAEGASTDGPSHDGAASGPEPRSPSEPASSPPTSPASDQASPESAENEAAPKSAEAAPPGPVAPVYRPNYAFLAIVTIVTIVLDLGSKGWAKSRLDSEDVGSDRRVEVVKGLVNFVFARNRGGAWGLLQDEHDAIRRPFFMLVSVAAILFIVSLYRKLTPQQLALKWGLPLVLGGAIGNLVDRIRYGHVIDFIDVHHQFIGWFNRLLGGRTDHWPTFNIADIAICVGVGLMAVDMFTSRKAAKARPAGGPVDGAAASGPKPDPETPERGS